MFFDGLPDRGQRARAGHAPKSHRLGRRNTTVRAMMAWAKNRQEDDMTKDRIRMMLIALLGFLASAGLATPNLAETGSVVVVFTKGGFIIGVGGGEGVLMLRGQRYPFIVSGMSVGATIGA